ncbi:hypothetical protein [Tenggerimyces flavus]|uniref:Uncharacterized protein n=1 Tax=Tenggerimyces flavus TaxID=1708749 RepID=A0ABV7Y3I9_9ACTN|nr:hypothetical protein [Tenggerimyces flavus]MBM7790762.1 hypothetical protein [Tenggerimyces flavus]
MAKHSMTRRIFLARVGVLGAAVGSGILVPATAHAGSAGPISFARNDPAGLPGLEDLVELLRPLLAELSRDTLNGLTTFVVPGRDAYSRAQGTPRNEPGALDAKATDFMIESLDNFVPFPQQLAQPMAAALTTALSDLGIDLPGPLDDLLPGQVKDLDDALRVLLENDATIPLSLVIALLLNLVATQVNPLSVHGAFVSPFARLSFEEKAKAFELMERTDSDLVALLDTQLPEPLRGSVSGLLKFVAGALIEFAGFGAFTEYAVFDPRTKKLRGTPVGWRLSKFDGVADGWNELKGYYQGRTKVED